MFKKALAAMLVLPLFFSGQLWAQKPHAVADTLIIKSKKPQLYNVLVNDYKTYDYKFNRLELVETGAGKVEVKSHGGVDKISYQANYEDDKDQDTFVYRICDKSGKCDTTRVLVVECPPKNPSFPKVEDVFVDKGKSVTFEYPGQFVKISKDVEVGVVERSADSSAVVYTPPAGFTGMEKLNFTVYEDMGLCGIHHINSFNNNIYVMPSDGENQPPVAVADEVETTPSRAVTIDVLANDYDPEGVLQYKIQSVTKPAHGKIRRTTKDVTYTPNSGFEGTDGFTYQICDHNNACAEGTVVINVSKK